MAKFKVGDRVKVSGTVEPVHEGKTGVVTEVLGGQLASTGKIIDVFSVKLDGRPVKPDGSPADHEYDCIGCVTEQMLRLVKE